jgi:hypothetical protein
MPSPPAKVHLIGQGSGQRHHAKSGLMFPPGGHFRIMALSQSSDEAGMLRRCLIGEEHIGCVDQSLLGVPQIGKTKAPGSYVTTYGSACSSSNPESLKQDPRVYDNPCSTQKMLDFAIVRAVFP